MKFISFEKDGQASFGAVVEGGVIDLGAKHGGLPDLRSAIRADRLGELIAEANEAEADHSLDDIEFLPTIPNPEKIICIGVNYANRNAEYKDGSEPPKYPSVFMRTRESLVGHEQDMLDPPESDQLDYEGEIVIVIGKEGRRIARRHRDRNAAPLCPCGISDRHYGFRDRGRRQLDGRHPCDDPADSRRRSFTKWRGPTAKSSKSITLLPYRR